MKWLSGLAVVAVLIAGVSGSSIAGGDKSHSSAGGYQQPASGQPVAGQPQVIEGVVQSVTGSTLTVKTDDGQTAVVDTDQVNQQVMQVVAVGKKVTIVGEFAPQENKIKAKSIRASTDGQGAASPPSRHDDQRGSAGPTSERPASKDDCKDGGWQRYGFSNQGQCVSSVAGEK